MSPLSRRAALATAAALAIPRRASAAERLVVIGHAVHRTATTTGLGGDVTEPWRKATGADIEWLTCGVETTNERALKEASLAQGAADIVFLLDRYTGPQYADLFEDLGAWQARDPIANFAEFPAGMLAAHRFGAKQTAIPFRHATHGLHINRGILAERAGAFPPATIEDALALAEKLSFAITCCW